MYLCAMEPGRGDPSPGDGIYNVATSCVNNYAGHRVVICPASYFSRRRREYPGGVEWHPHFKVKDARNSVLPIWREALPLCDGIQRFAAVRLPGDKHVKPLISSAGEILRNTNTISAFAYKCLFCGGQPAQIFFGKLLALDGLCPFGGV